MKKILILFLTTALFGCAGLTKNTKPNNTNNSTIPKSLKVKNLDIEVTKVASPNYIYTSEIQNNEKITSIEIKEVVAKKSDNKSTNKIENKVVIKSEKISQAYQPEFDTSFIFQEEKKLKLNYNNLDNITDSFNVPVTINDRVKKYLDRFTSTSRGVMQRWINNSFKYIFYIKDVFQNYGLPTDLAYLPLAESGFDPIVRSRAGAVGMWQFMEHTGKLYGLRVNYWLDERKDFEKSTDAAARHLRDLYEKFNDWNLALAAYNAGAGRIQRAIDKFNTEDYFELSSYRHLAEETKDYVPKYTALMIIHKNLLQYGFEYPDIEPITYEKVELDYPVNLFILSKLIGIEMSQIIDLNPSLRRWITPPNDTFELKIPTGYKDKVLAVLNNYSPEELLQVRIYTPSKKEKVSDIAKKYKVSTNQIIAMNGFKKPVVRAGFPVLIPSETGNIEITQKQLEEMTKISDIRETPTITYKVQKGDTLQKIAKKFKTTVKSIQSTNSIKNIKVGMNIEIPVKQSIKSSKKTANKTVSISKTSYITYKVKKGDTIYKLASKYDTQPQSIIKLNNIKTLKPGQTIKIPRS